MSFKLFLGLGTAVLILITLYTRSKYNVQVWKRIVFALSCVVFGVLGTMIMFFIEARRFGGRSFFGAVFFTPVFLVLFGRLLKIKPLDVLDMYAPAEAGMLVVMKINCYLTRCCAGRVIRVTEYGKKIRFPSQICEGVAALLILVLLLIMITKKKDRGNVYFWFMVVYGVVRFILNLFRETTPFVLNLPAGNFWALISFMIGGVILLVRHHSGSTFNLKNMEE